MYSIPAVELRESASNCWGESVERPTSFRYNMETDLTELTETIPLLPLRPSDVRVKLTDKIRSLNYQQL
jgi:hypothetical protein